jgi:multiple sugar transport system ATP-binding protein
MLKLHSVSKRFASTVAVNNFSLVVSRGEFMTLLGPSGCGKTTLIRLVAGLEVPDSGNITMDGDDWAQVVPQKRNVAFVFQHFALYPYRTVRGNIEYPLRLRKMDKEGRASRIGRISTFLGLETLLDRKPSQLSGGEAQRVALARALVREPTCFLMDEPLSNLDAQLRVRARAEIRRIQREFQVTTIYVTHDQDEAIALGDRIAVMNEGQLIQVGTPGELFRKPGTTFVAGFLGKPPMNIIPGTVTVGTGHGLSVRLKALDSSPLFFHGFAEVKVSEGQDVCIGFRPDHVRLVDETFPEAPGALMLKARIEMVEGLEPDFIAHCQTSVGMILARTTSQPEVGPAHILLLASQAHVFDAKTQNRLE